MPDSAPDLEKVKSVFRSIAKANPSRDIYLISSEINRKLYRTLSDITGKVENTKPECLVFLNTHGGDPHAAYRIARCLRHHYGHIRLAVPHYCKSAGTLIAIGANELAIGDMGELGPLDVQVSKRTELFEASSGLDFNEAMNAMLDQAQAAFRSSLLDIRVGSGISTKMAGEFASQIAVGLLAPMYSQIDPIQIGEIHRAMKVAHEYGTRLNADSESLKRDALLELVSGYPDHSFVIDRKEAQSLFHSVKHLTVEEKLFSSTLWAEMFRDEGDGVCMRIAAIVDDDSNDSENGSPSDDPSHGQADASASDEAASPAADLGDDSPAAKKSD